RLAKRSLLAVRPEVVLQRLRFDTELRGLVLDDHGAEIGLAGLGAERREFGARHRNALHAGRRKRLRLEYFTCFSGVLGPRQRAAGGDVPGRVQWGRIE